MKKSVKILLILLLVLVVVIGAVTVWQWDNIKAVKLFLSSSQEELEALRTENDETMVQVMEEMEELQLKPLEEADRERLRTGDLTREEAVQMVMGLLTGAEAQEQLSAAADGSGEQETAASGGSEATSAEAQTGPAAADTDPAAAFVGSTAQAKPGQEPAAGGEQEGQESASPASEQEPLENTSPEQEPETTGPKSIEDPDLRRIAELVATAYVMRDVYVGYLEDIKTTAAEDYYAIPEEERTRTARVKLASRCIEEATELEAQCDGEMDDLLAELSQLLEKTGRTQSLAQQVKAVYAQEKAVKKAYYMSLYTE